MNNPEYCQNIYEAAKKVTELHERDNIDYVYRRKMDYRIEALKRALEGKENV